MRFLLDTMVISEAARQSPDPQVAAWLGSHASADLGISVLTLGEIAKGVEMMAEGRRRRDLAGWLETDLPGLFRDRVLWIDQAVAIRWGQLAGQHKTLPVVDGLLVATASVHRLELVTRNVKDTAGLGVPILDPWTSQRYEPDQRPG